MKLFKRIILLNIMFLITLLFSTTELFGQAGMRFPELSKKLEAYYDTDLINDVRKVLPENDNFSIWGWDVGDFSGDGFYDLAISVKYLNDKRKVVQVYLFVDIDGFLTMVGQFPYEYFEMPLEIGVSINDNGCFVTKKRELFNWVLKGYRFDNGALILLDEFHTQKIDQLTNEKYRNYQTNETSDKYLLTKNGISIYYTDFATLPSYSRGRMVYKGFCGEVRIEKPEYVYEGAFWWKDTSDLSYSVKSNYDTENIYFTVNVSDEDVVPTRCDSCNGDFVELWFDLYPLISGKDRYLKDVKDKTLNLRSIADTGIYCISISPGDFLETRAFLKGVKSTDSVDEQQQMSANKVKAVSTLNSKGYSLKIKIPYEVLGIDLTPEDENTASLIGFSIVVNDVDNEFRAEETTKMASSRFDSKNPASFGELLLLPEGQWYGESYNIFHDDIIKVLSEAGF